MVALFTLCVDEHRPYNVGYTQLEPIYLGLFEKSSHVRV